MLSQFKKGESRFEFLLGSTFQQSVNTQEAMQGYGFDTNALIQNIGASKTKVISDLVKTDYKYAALFGRFNYNLKKRYIINLTARRDGSSRFGPNNRFANFGAAGAAWIFSEENLFSGMPWLSTGKLRASIGTSGNDRIGDYQFLDTYSVSSNIYDGTVGLVPSRLYNPDFSWEKTLKREMAIEFSLFKARLQFAASYYNNRSSSQLVGIPLSAVTGFSSVQANLPATVQNSGWEFELYAQPFSHEALVQWKTSFNLSVPRSKLLEFPNLEASTYSKQYIVGQPMQIALLYNFEGIDPNTGIYKFTDYNNDGKITSADDAKKSVTIGPSLFGGWANHFTFKNFSFDVLIQFVKQQNYNYNRTILLPGTFNNQPVEVLDVWSSSNPAGTYMPYSTGVNIQFIKPALSEIKMYFEEKDFLPEEAEKFFNHYESNGWLVGGKSKMKNWQAAARNWMINSKKFQNVIAGEAKQSHLSATTNKSYQEKL